MSTSSLSDILSAAKNIASGLNGSSQVMLALGGARVIGNIINPLLVQAGQGRVVRISVVDAGSTAGAVHDAASVETAAATNKIWSIPNTVGITDISLPINNGIVIIPGTDQRVVVSFS